MSTDYRVTPLSIIIITLCNIFDHLKSKFVWSFCIINTSAANKNNKSTKGIPVLFQGSFGSTKRLVRWVFDVEFSITDYLFWIWVVRVGRSWLIYLQRESDLLIRVSYHTQTAFEKHERAPERLPWNRTGIPLWPLLL